MKGVATQLALLGMSAALWGCPGRADIFDEPYSVLGPMPLAGRLVWSFAPAQTLVVLDPAQPDETLTYRLGFAPRDLAVAGERIIAVGIDDEGPAASVRSLQQEGTTRVALPAVFDRVLPSPSGGHAILLFDPGRAPGPGSPAARNANEIAVLDLGAGTATRVVLQTESLAPRAVEFSPVGTLAAVVLDSAVVVLDLAAPSRRVQVPLILPGGARLVPQEASFSSDGTHLFLRAAGTSDVLSLSVDDSGEDLSGHINFLFASGAKQLHDLIVPSGSEFAGLVAAVFSKAAGQGSLVALLDADGDRSRTRSAALNKTVTRIEDLGDGLLLLHGAQAAAPTRAGPDIVAWQPLMDRVSEGQLAGAMIGTPAVAGKAAFFRHEVPGGGQALTSVSVKSEPTRLRISQSPLVLFGDPVDITADPASGTVLLGVQVPRKDSGAAPDYDDNDRGNTGSVVFVTPEDSGIRNIVLDEVVTEVGAVGDFFFALHPDDFGDLTFIPKADPTRAASHRRDGFLLSGLLDVGAEE